MSSRLTRGIAVLGACALVAACSKSEKKEDSAAVADSIAKANAAMPAPAPTPPALTDANILAMLDEANSGEVAEGKVAATKGTGADVKAFGRQMEKDHGKLKADGAALAKKLNITPMPPANDTLPAAAARMDSTIKAMAAGRAWDKAYIDDEVVGHQAVVDMLQNFQNAAQDSTLKAAIGQAIPVVQGHLTKAQAIQTKLAAKP